MFLKLPIRLAMRNDPFGISNFARRFAAMVVLRLPRGYEILTPQLRYILLYWMRRPHERDFRALTQLEFGNFPVLVDVGANIGQSVLSLYTLFPAATVVSFEPNPAVFPKLQRLTRKFPRLTVVPTGLSDETAEAELFIPSYNGNALTGLASFDYESAKNWLRSDRVLGFDPNKLRVSSTRLSLVRLDDCALRPDFIKIDVQGLEHRVIAGGLETIRAYRPVIMAETIACGSQAHKIVEPLDYRLVEFDGCRFAEVGGAPLRLNQFLIPAERLRDPPLLLILRLHYPVICSATLSGLQDRVRCGRTTTGVVSRPDVSEPVIARRKSKPKATTDPAQIARRTASHTGEAGSAPIASVTTTAPPMRGRRSLEVPGTCRPVLADGRVRRASRA